MIAQGSSTSDRLVESEQRMQLLIGSIRDYAIFMLDPMGHIATWNAGAQQIKGYTADEIIGRHFSTFYPQEDIDAGKCERELVVAAETGRFEEEAWRVRKDGALFWANVVISAVRDESGVLLGFAKVTRDLTERRRAEEQRIELIAAAATNRAKDDFMAMLGHELRNPLAPIMAALEILTLRRDPDQLTELDIIERHAHHLVHIVDDLLDVARITQHKIELDKQRLELGDIVARAVESAAALIDAKQHRLTLAVASEGLAIDGDATRLTQVVVNLLNNAAKYTPPKGTIEITAQRDADHVVLEISDNGIGLHDELASHVFELFVQGARSSDRRDGGLGLGLSLVRSLVHLHGGTVAVKSAGANQGTRFTVRLPVSSARLVAFAPALSTRAATQRRRVLVVDDNIDAAEMLSQLIALLGHEVRVAHDAQEALAVLDGFAPELAILDIGMPGMDGHDLARLMDARLESRCVLVALTGYGQESDRDKSRAAGFNEHLVKPVDGQQLRRVLAMELPR